MKLGTEFPQMWKDKSEKDGILLSDILYGYVVENLLLRIQKISLYKYLWLTNEESLGIEAYKKATKERLEYIYIQKEKKTNSLSLSGIETLVDEIISQEKESGLIWKCTIKEMTNGFFLLWNCDYMDMQVPVSMSVKSIQYVKQIPNEKELNLMFEERKVCKYFSYPRENILSEELFEIMRKLELVSNMKTYDQVNDILKSQSINGRRVLDVLKTMGEKEPKVVSMKRMDVISSYVNYGYMKKRWKQYSKRYKTNADEWEVVMERIISFVSPLWKALCEDEIFFDDWMPELGRFLG